MKIAIVHDALVNCGGAERVVATLHECFPGAPIYTSVYLPTCTHASLGGADIRPTFLQKLAPSEALLKLLFPLSYWAMGRLDLSGYDVVLSSSTFCAKNVAVPQGVLHICYCYSCFRPAWEFQKYVAQCSWGPVRKAAVGLLFACFRRFDYQAAQNPERLVAISEHAARKIQRAYRRTAVVIYPPVDVARYPLARCSEDFFLVASRLMPYKRIDIVVEAFSRLGHPLKVVGTGPDLERLKSLAGSNVEFIGAVSEQTLTEYYSRCRALIFPGEEDFGLVPLEAHACGKPVLALGRGGALETLRAVNHPGFPVSPRQATGVYFFEQTPEAVVEALRQFEKLAFSPDVIRARAWEFDKSRFHRELLALIGQTGAPTPRSLSSEHSLRPTG